MIWLIIIHFLVDHGVMLRRQIIDRFLALSFEDPVRANDYLIRKELWRLAGDESHVLPLPGR